MAIDAPAPPLTAWARADWVALLARLSVGFARAADHGGSPAAARFDEAVSASPADPIPSLEGFARLLVAWGAWLGQAANPTALRFEGRTVDVLDSAVAGLAAGTDPTGRWWWGPIEDRDQRIVEASELAVGLWLGRSRLVPALGPLRLERTLDWLGGVDGRAVYQDNWVLFPAIVATIRRGLGAVVPDRAIDRGLDEMMGWYRGDGWYADGAGHAFDLYTGWAIHWDLLLWAAIDGRRRPRLRKAVLARAATYLADLLAMAGTDGAIPLFGRSLAYRFAEVAPLGLAAALGILELDPGQVRRRMSSSIRHYLDSDALNPATNWFRLGVHGERPQVCEPYVSAGSLAWAAHALVPLALAPDDPFWTAPEAPLQVEVGDGQRVLRGPAIAFGWRHSTGDSWLISARGDHPIDIPNHDYRTAYGKAIYTSAFPFNVRAGDGLPGPDAAVILEGDGEVGHRDLTLAGGVGPDWSWSRYRVAVDGRQHGVTAIALRAGDAWLRVTGIRPSAPVRAIEGCAALATLAAARISRSSNVSAGWESATDGHRSVAIRRLAGYDGQRASAPFRAATDVNLVAPYAEQPTVHEVRRSGRRRVLAALTLARTGPIDADADLAGFRIDVPDPATAIAIGPDGQVAWFAVGGHARRAVRLGGWLIEGPGLRIARIDGDGNGLAGEAIGRVAGVIRLERPAPLDLRRKPERSVEIGTTGGFALDPLWTGRPLTALFQRGAHGWLAAGRLDRPGIVPGALVRAIARQSGHAYVRLRLEP